MLNKPIYKVLFLDIETTTQYATYAELPERMQNLFYKRFEKEIIDFTNREELILDQTPSYQKKHAFEEIYNIKGPLFTEFNKVICVSIGVIDTKNPEQYKLLTKSFTGDENTLLQEFIKSKLIANFQEAKQADKFSFCAHNGMVFDFPVLAKRMIYNGIDLPFIFDYTEKKPWDVDYFIDTKNIWKWGVFDGNTSLDLLAAAFDVESSKNLMSGDQVKEVYYKGGDGAIEKIKEYCEADVLALARVYLKMKNIQIPLIKKSA